MALVHLASIMLFTLAGLSRLEPHAPPAICPNSHAAMSQMNSSCAVLWDVVLFRCIIHQSRLTDLYAV